jgi:hypothetical protein
MGEGAFGHASLFAFLDIKNFWQVGFVWDKGGAGREYLLGRLCGLTVPRGSENRRTACLEISAWVTATLHNDASCALPGAFLSLCKSQRFLSHLHKPLYAFPCWHD